MKAELMEINYGELTTFLVYIYRLYNIVTISINFILNGTQYKNLKDSLFTE